MYRVKTILEKLFRTIYWRVGLETIAWAVGLLYLAIHNPYVQSDFTICPLENIGYHHCPGCGLGRSVSFLLHGDVVRSVQTHILGIPATIILFLRTFSLLNGSFKGNVLKTSIH